jgi:hypothetical protein
MATNDWIVELYVCEYLLKSEHNCLHANIDTNEIINKQVKSPAMPCLCN